MRSISRRFVANTGMGMLFMMLHASAADGPIQLNLRSRSKETSAPVERKASWEPKKTALIVCDMWDDHWCQSAARRVTEMAGPLNEVIQAARACGLFIIHAPSTCTEF